VLSVEAMLQRRVVGRGFAWLEEAREAMEER